MVGVRERESNFTTDWGVAALEGVLDSADGLKVICSEQISPLLVENAFKSFTW